MARYQDRVNYVAHNLNNLTILLDGNHKVVGLESLEAELDEDEVTSFKTATGHGLPVENPSESGIITLSFLEASATTDKLFALAEAGAYFAFSAFDEASADFDVSCTHARVMKRPAISRTAEPTVSEWQIQCTYLDIKGGSYALATAS